MSRRSFMKNTRATLPFLSAGSFFHSEFPSDQVQSPGATIKKISIFNASGSFYRFIGMNAYDEVPKGIHGTRQYFTIELSDGTLGLGTVGYTSIDDNTVAKMKSLIGKDPFSLYTWENDKISGISPKMEDFVFNFRYTWVESGLLDILGKLKNCPVWKLYGDEVREGIDVYDGTLYFEDIANNTDARIIGEIGKRIKNDGYRAIKIKLGRPLKWSPGEAGLNRDIEAFIALREAVGQNFILMADANNGYKDKYDWGVKLLKACAPYNMYFMEELFPEDTSQYRQVREELLKENFFIPIGEGENIRRLEKFGQYCEDGVYNYIQPDMPTCGFSNILITARKTTQFPHVKLIPHVWQSQFGLVMSLHASKIQANIPYAEDSRYFGHALAVRGQRFDRGQWFLSEQPGWGIELIPDFREFVKGEEIVIS